MRVAFFGCSRDNEGSVNLAASIPDWIWKLFPDSMGGFISAVWLVLFWILRAVALRGSENGSSPYRGLLCSAAAFCGVAALGAGGLVLVALFHIQSFGLLLAIVAVPVCFLAFVCGYMFYQGARGDFTSRAEPNDLRSG
jgi:fatty acid desaturase